MDKNELIISNQPFRVVLVMGPTSAPGSTGNILRDVAAVTANEAANAQLPLALDGFNIELRERCHAAFKLYGEDKLPCAWFQFEDSLQDPTDYFNGLTPGSAYAAFQSFCHSFMSEDILGQWVVERTRYYQEAQRKLPPDQRATGILLADIASVEDYKNVIGSFGPENVTLIQVRAKGAVDLSARIVPELEVGRKVEVEYTSDKEELAKAIRAAAPNLFIKIATQI